MPFDINFNNYLSLYDPDSESFNKLQMKLFDLYNDDLSFDFDFPSSFSNFYLMNHSYFIIGSYKNYIVYIYEYKSSRVIIVLTNTKKPKYILSYHEILISESIFLRKGKFFNLYIDGINKVPLYSEFPIKLSPIEVYTKKNNKISNKRIGSFDLETVNSSNYKDNLVIAVGYSVFKNVNRVSNTFKNHTIVQTNTLNDLILVDNNNTDIAILSNNLVINCIIDLITNYPNYTFYVHNLSGFDQYYLVNYIVKYNITAVKLIFMDILFSNELIYKITLTMVIKGKYHTIYFQDSHFLLNSSLKSLCEVYNLPSEFSKSYFPYDFVTLDNLNYIGPSPDSSFYKDLPDHFILNDSFDLNLELKLYLKNDVLSLLYIMELFRLKIFSLFKADLVNNITISRLSLTAFNELTDNLSLVPAINIVPHYDFIRNTLYGGITEIYKPKGYNLYFYDINSFYPFSALNDMIGFDCSIVSINSDLSDSNYIFDYDNNLGFFEADVIAPSHLPFGLLPHRKNDGSISYPLCSFTGS